jgi:hypothetical protein
VIVGDGYAVAGGHGDCFGLEVERIAREGRWDRHGLRSRGALRTEVLALG